MRYVMIKSVSNNADNDKDTNIPVTIALEKY